MFFCRCLIVVLLCSGGSLFASIFEAHDARAREILENMTLDEKIGQMLHPTFGFLTNQKGKDAMDRAIAAWDKESDEELWYTLGFDAIKTYHLGSVLQPGGPITYSGKNQGNSEWQKLTRIAKLNYQGPGDTPLLIGNDAIHGDQHVPGRILFPQNIGLGATHNPDLVKSIGRDTMLNLLFSGFNWAYMPTVAVAHDYRWGRTYESFSSDPNVVEELAKSYVAGFQDVQGKEIKGVLATAKHFIADGDTKKGIDEGYSYGSSLREVWETNGRAIDSDVATVMASYSSLNSIPMHFGGGFSMLQRMRNSGIQGSRLDGFVVSDYVGVSKAAYKYNLRHRKKIDYAEAIAKSINGGVDMFMISDGAWVDFFAYDSKPPHTMHSALYYTDIPTVVEAIKTALKKRLISQERIDDAVFRILRVKLALTSQEGSITVPEQAEHALDAAQQSLVLLKNKETLLPLDPEKIEHVFLLGAYDDIGSQNGGWTITWQGQKGNEYWEEGSEYRKTSHASSVLDGLNSLLQTPIYHEGEKAILEGEFTGLTPQNSIAIITLAEYPYAEYNSDVDNGNPWYYLGYAMKQDLYTPAKQPTFLGFRFSRQQLKAIDRLKKMGVPIVTILFSGRPVVISEGRGAPLPLSDALIAAFLPGPSGGEALANAMFGRYAFKSVKNVINGKEYSSNTLPFAWPATMKEVRTHRPTLFPAGYGLQAEMPMAGLEPAPCCQE